MKHIIKHYSSLLRAEITVSPQWTLTAQNVLRDDPLTIPVRSFIVTSNISNFNYMTVVGVQANELIEVIERVTLATHAYMELMYGGGATESKLQNIGFK